MKRISLDTVEQPVLLYNFIFTTEFEIFIDDTPYFGQFDYKTDIDIIDFDVVFQSVEVAVFIWYRMLVYVLSNPRVSRDSYINFSDLRRKILVIISMIYYSRAKKRSINFFIIFDVFLIGSGVKRRVIEILAGFGLYHDYKYGNRLISQVV